MPRVRAIQGYSRDERWRPLMPEETVTQNVPQTDLDYFHASGIDTPDYYLLAAEKR